MTTLPPPLDQLDVADQQAVSRYLTQVRFEPGAVIFAAGSSGTCGYIIEEGEVRLDVPRPELDSDGVLGYLAVGSMLGELSLLDGLPRSATAIAESAVVAQELSSDALSRLSVDHPSLAAAVLGALGQHASRKLRQSNTVLAEHIFPEGRDPEVDDMVARAAAAQRNIEAWDETRMDALLGDIASTIAEHAGQLARETVEETHIGDVADKTMKNTFASVGVFSSIEGKPGIGVVSDQSDRLVTEIAAPVGVVFGLIPMTNPVATAVFKVLIALKARNALILSFHRACMGVGNHTGELIQEVLARHGAPSDVLQWVRSRADRKKTARFMAHEDVSLILATGGPGMVKAAYASGTPAIGVGSGNAPTFISASADVERAAEAIVLSKSFDNGLICGSEHNLIVDASRRTEFVAALERAGAAVLTPAETGRFGMVFNEERTGFRPEVVGQAATLIAHTLGIARAWPIRLLVVPTEIAEAGPLAGEKMAPVVSLFTTDGDDEALELSLRLLANQGAGHTAIIHAEDESLVERFSRVIPASRILVNSPGSHGVCGITSGLSPSFTLGCGTFGGTSTTDNVSYRHLQNIKRLARVIA